MALNGLVCADVPLRNYSFTHSPPGKQHAIQPTIMIITIK